MQTFARHAWPIARCLVLLVVAACGGTDDDGAPAQTPTGPAASFTAAGTAVTDGAVVFDAGASTSSDGSALQYRWDFGDGQRGGGNTIAHVFANAGAPTVTLTVFDGAGLSASAARTVTVSAATAGGSVRVHARITGPDGVAIDGVAITPTGSATALATSDTAGRADLTLERTRTVALSLAKAGYADQFLAVQLPATAGDDTLVEATMTPRDAPLTLADAHAGGSVAGRAGATLTLPADALVTGAGTLASGAVQIALTPVDVTSPGAGGFPGRFDGVKPDGTTTPIVSFGAVEFALASGGEKLQLAPGKTATIEVPIWGVRRPDGSDLVPGDTTPLWSLDTASAIWVQEGTGTVVASAASPSGLAMRATVSHFSWWNSDLGFDPYGPKPRCVYDTDAGIPGGSDTFATATVCNMLAEIDRGLGGTSDADRSRAQAVRQAPPLPPRVAGYSRRATVPIAGGVTLPVPAGVGVALNAGALNGTWSGRRVVNGPVGVQEEVEIKMRPVAGSGPGIEAVALPFDATRALITGQTARFSFSAGARQFARIIVAPGPGSNLMGQARLLQGTTALASANFGPQTGSFTQVLPGAGSYIVEVTGIANTPGSYRLQIELVGGELAESLPFPLDVTKSLPAYTTYVAGFDVAAAGVAHIALQASQALLRVTDAGGNVLYADTDAGVGTATKLAEVALPAAGHYSIEVAGLGGATTQLRLTAEPTAWLAIAPGLDVSSGFAIIDLVADRDDKPVIGFERNVVVGGQNVQTIVLQRWTGSAWESVGIDLDVDTPCSGGPGLPSVSFAFDSSNAPVLVFARSNAMGSASTTTALRFSAGAWQPLGPDGGVLPIGGGFGESCGVVPRAAIDANDQPIVAYRAAGALTVQRLVSGVWRGLASPTADTFAYGYGEQGSFDITLDANGDPWLVHAINGAGKSVVRRFDAGTSAWLTVGPNAGKLPETTTAELAKPRLLFDASGNPVIAALAAVIVSPGVTTTGSAVYRYDGSAWQTTGAHLAGPNSYNSNTHVPGFALSAGGALIALANSSAGVNSLVVQRNTPAGWSPVGAGLGEVVQYFPHAITPDAFPIGPRLLAIGADVYLALVARTDPNSNTQKITLLKKTGN